MLAVDVTGPAIPRLSRAEIARFIRACYRHLAKYGRLTEVSIAFLSDPGIRKLNREYRGQDKPTDVLTFPGEIAEIVISLATAKRQAAAEGHSLATEVRYLLLHGLIHALGFDHETDQGEMDALEMQIRSKAGF